MTRKKIYAKNMLKNPSIKTCLENQPKSCTGLIHGKMLAGGHLVSIIQLLCAFFKFYSGNSHHHSSLPKNVSASLEAVMKSTFENEMTNQNSHEYSRFDRRKCNFHIKYKIFKFFTISLIILF